MTTFTSSLPESLLKNLGKAAKELNVPKNKIIEKALNIYLEQLDKAMFKASYKKAKGDQDLLTIAEEGSAEYLSQLTDWDEAK